MKLAKRLMAASLALMMAVGMASCSKSGSSDTKSVAPGKDLNSSQKDKIGELASKLPDVKLDNTTIKWMAHYDINPTDGKVKSPAIELFKQKYNGKVEFVQTSWDSRYTDLATAVLGNTSPDFFPADDMDTFPKGAIKAMFQPIDDYVDLNSDLWAKTKAACDSFMFNGKHYIAVVGTSPNYVCMYNKTTMKENGYEDPADLFAKGEWDWDVFTEMCLDFTDSEAEKYALDGYWYSKAISESCGVPMIGLEDGKVVSNMADPKIEKVQTMMYNLQKNGVVFPRSDNNWKTRGDGANGEGLGSYLTLFIPIGLWAIEDTVEKTKTFGDMEAGEIMFVPMPKDPDSDTYYLSSRVSGYNICTGAPNPQGVSAFLNCAVIANQEVQDINTEILKNDYKWSDEMLEMREKVLELCNTNPVFDLQEGVSPELSSLMLNVSQATMISGGNETTWTACRAEYEKSVEWTLKDANSNISTTPVR